MPDISIGSAELPAGSKEREQFELQARQADTVSHINAWLTHPAYSLRPLGRKCTLGGPQAEGFASRRVPGLAVEFAERVENLVNSHRRFQAIGRSKGRARSDSRRI